MADPTSGVSLSRLDDAARRTLLPRFLLGEFDPPQTVPFWDTTKKCSVIGCPAHQQLAYEAAAQSLVLLKNKGILPLKGKPKVALIGPFTHPRWMYARYGFVPIGGPLLVSLYSALSSRLPSGHVSSTYGCRDWNSTTACESLDSEAVERAADEADVLILCLGDGEEIGSEMTNGIVLDLPGLQKNITNIALQVNKPVVTLLFTASPKNGAWMDRSDAVVAAWYPQNGGAAAISDMLLGKFSPSGRLPMQWPKQWSCRGGNGGTAGDGGNCDVMPAQLYGTNVTYRYGSNENVLFPFAYGTSFSTFTYSNLKMRRTIKTCEALEVSLTVTNTGPMASAVIVPAFVQWLGAARPTPTIALVAFSKIELARGEQREVTLRALPRSFAVLHNASTTHSLYLDPEFASIVDPTPPRWISEPMSFNFFVGGDAVQHELSTRFTVTGEATPLDECPQQWQ
eukprot:SAG31_NODE_5976_length_2229_cov_3.461340_2_plen_454_part_00